MCKEEARRITSSQSLGFILTDVLSPTADEGRSRGLWQLYTDFLVNIARLLKRKDKVKLLRLALSVADAGSVEVARVLYELCPYLSVDEKRRYGAEALGGKGLPALAGLVVLTNCLNYLSRDEVVKKTRALTEIFRGDFPARSSSPDFEWGFTAFVLQQGLATLVENDTDSVSAIADITRQKDLIMEATQFFKGSTIWSARARLAQAWMSYQLSLRTSAQREPKLFSEAERECVAALRLLRKFDDHGSLYSAYRLLYLFQFRRFHRSSIKEKKTGILLRQMKRYAILLIQVAELMEEPAHLAGAYTNLGIALRYQADFESAPKTRRRLLETGRQMHLKAVSAVKHVSDDLVAVHLYNAGSVLIELIRTEPNTVKINELIETALKEMDEVIKLSTSSTDPSIRLSATIGKLVFMDELAGMNPFVVTGKVLAELDQLGKELEQSQLQMVDQLPFVDAYMNLSLHCLKLLRVGGAYQKNLVERAERSALKAYKIAEDNENYAFLGFVLYNVASILMVKGILNHDPAMLDQACYTAEKSCDLLRENGGIAATLSQSLVTETHILKYGYMGDRRELSKAIASSGKTISDFMAHKYFHLAAGESFRLATIHILVDEDEESMKVLKRAAALFRRSGKLDLRFRKVFGNLSTSCRATSKLVQAQIAYRAGQQLEARRLVENAEKEMTKANARWREVWLIRGFKELVSGNLEEARINLARVINDSLDVIEDESPASTGYTAKKLVSYMDRGMKKKKELPPTVIGLPLRNEVIMTALRLDGLSKQLSSVPSFGAYTEQQELSVEEIKELINRIMQIQGRKGKTATK